jgi:hypothetical protein
MTEMLDHEVVELLASDPELLAFADAVAAARSEPRRRHDRRRYVAVAAVAAALALLALVAPWDRSGATLVQRAQAAIGTAPVLHAVTRETLDAGQTLVDLDTRERTPLRYVQEQEIWFDGNAKLAHTITRTNGVVTDDVLETASGGVTLDGPEIICAWIARHPEIATKERVSCRFDGDNAKVRPIDFPPQPPSVDPALGGFLTQYRDALAEGRAAKVGEGVVDGRPVYWLSISIAVPNDPTAPPNRPVAEHELVAIDRDTYRPVLVRTIVDGVTARSYRVLEIKTVERDGADFTRPERRAGRARPTIGEGTGKTSIDRAGAEQVLQRPPLWLGAEFDGFTLSSIERQGVITGYERSSGSAPRTDTAVVLTYSDGTSQVRLVESTRPLYAFGWFQGPLATTPIQPPARTVLLSGIGGYVIRDGVDIAIQAPAAPDAVIAAARALRPM